MLAGSCFCPSFSRFARMASPLRALENKPPNSYFTADDMKFVRITLMVRISMLCMLGFGELGLFPKYN